MRRRGTFDRLHGACGRCGRGFRPSRTRACLLLNMLGSTETCLWPEEEPPSLCVPHGVKRGEEREKGEANLSFSNLFKQDSMRKGSRSMDPCERASSKQRHALPHIVEVDLLPARRALPPHERGSLIHPLRANGYACFDVLAVQRQTEVEW